MSPPNEPRRTVLRPWVDKNDLDTNWKKSRSNANWPKVCRLLSHLALPWKGPKRSSDTWANLGRERFLRSTKKTDRIERA